MGRLKTAVVRARRIKLNKERRRDNLSVIGFAGGISRAVAPHSSEGHWLRLTVNDDCEALECVVCGILIVAGSDELMKDLMEKIESCGIEFEVLCETEEVHEARGNLVQQG